MRFHSAFAADSLAASRKGALSGWALRGSEPSSGGQAYRPPSRLRASWASPGADLPLLHSQPRSAGALWERASVRHAASPERASANLLAVSGSAPALAMAATAPAAEPAEVLVKASTGNPDQLGDCPFSQRVLITLEEKGIPYTYRLVDTANKPQWFLEANPEGKVPVYKRHGAWLADSDAIASALEEDYPDAPKLAAAPEKASVGGSLFGAFARFLKGAGPEEDLLTQLQALDDALKASGGPFVEGAKFSAVDAKLAPALFHIQVALKHFKNWTIPEKFTHVLNYVKALESRDSFKKTAPSESAVIAGWNRALGINA